MYQIEDTIALGQAIRQQRETRGMTQAALARAAGLTRPRLSLIERGSANPSLSSILRLAQALGLQLMMEPESPRPTLTQLRRAQQRGEA